ncbi:MAG TPA: gamma-glutamylcyclotransferase family protein [Pseudomonadales bacterium]|nr:gamma-glutamylcyclotransferase family protein [Pseudomonadales bacterium]
MPLECLFVYGSLRKNIHSKMQPIFAQHCTFLSLAFMNGQLFEINGYPGAIESQHPQDIIEGELYEINAYAPVLPLLDEYEECSDHFPLPHEYFRKKIKVRTIAGKKISAWAYIYNRDVSQLERIVSGNYLAYLNKK